MMSQNEVVHNGQNWKNVPGNSQYVTLSQ